MKLNKSPFKWRHFEPTVASYNCLTPCHTEQKIKSCPFFLYKFISLPLALAGYVVFSVWPGGARVTYGWFFDLF